MRIRIIAVGTKMPDWVEQGYAEYAKRMPRDCVVEMVELPLAQRSKNSAKISGDLRGCEKLGPYAERFRR